MNLHNIKTRLLLLVVLFLSGCDVDKGILSPKGVVAFEERELFFNSAAIMSMVVLTVIIMSIIFVYHYRDGNNKTEYKPEWCHSVFLECIWWGVPCLIILILSIYTWIATHKLDPYRKLNYPGKVMNVQVVALPWKWLFIYPDSQIATINKLVLPKNKQVEFYLTSDNVPMSAFFIPQLGSQIYTMAGMRTRLHLIPTHLGTFEGLNATYNGDGFAGMRFKVEIVSEDDFNQWQQSVQASAAILDLAALESLRKPSINNAEEYFSNADTTLFNKLIHKYMMSAEHPESLGNTEA